MAQLPATFEDTPNPADLTERERAQLWHSLTDLQQEWLLEYLQNGRNATQAAKDAGYQASGEADFCQIGYDNRHHDKISQLISAVSASLMDLEEVLARLGALAKTDMQDFLAFDEDGRPIVDLKQARQRGALHAIKKIDLERTVDPDTGEVTTEVDLTLYDRRKALSELLGYLGEPDKESGEGDTFQQFNFNLDQHHKGEGSVFDAVDNTL